MAWLWYLSHPEVVVDPEVPVPDWGLNEIGSRRVQDWIARGTFAGVGRIVSSTERKARETAAPIAQALGIEPDAREDLGENDRSATGFLPPAEFETARQAFFAAPSVRYRGWETAEGAQVRVAKAAAEVVAGHDPRRDLLLVGHGAVGTLLWCHLAGKAIDVAHDQPAGGGCVWCAPLGGGAPEAPWARADDASSA
ncbi:MAG: histidine phosphatase family protein [Pseudomonadota bacterium]